jgi:hypothetical protein
MLSNCNCRECLIERMNETPWKEHGLPDGLSIMVVCSTCGFKRCPHATNHKFPCTNSNEPGQEGSIY